MVLLIAGLVIFFGIHSLRMVAPGFRERMIENLGQGPWRGVYSLLSLAGFIFLVVGFGQARLQPVMLYQSPFWLRGITVALMLPALILLLATYLPGRIKSTVKHPTLAAIKIWALAHLLANGDLASVLLFGSFLIWAVVLRVQVKHRPAQATVPVLPMGRFGDLLSVLLGAGVWAWLAYGGLHQMLIGVPVV